MLNAEVEFRIHVQHSFDIQHSELALLPCPNVPARVGEQIREELTELLAREVHDPGIGFLTITRVKVTADLQQARVYYTTLGDAKARKRDEPRARARDAVPAPADRPAGCGCGACPSSQFFFDESIERQDRIERILQELQAERAGRTRARPTASADVRRRRRRRQPR